MRPTGARAAVATRRRPARAPRRAAGVKILSDDDDVEHRVLEFLELRLHVDDLSIPVHDDALLLLNHLFPLATLQLFLVFRIFKVSENLMYPAHDNAEYSPKE